MRKRSGLSPSMLMHLRSIESERHGWMRLMTTNLKNALRTYLKKSLPKPH